MDENDEKQARRALEIYRFIKNKMFESDCSGGDGTDRYQVAALLTQAAMKAK